MTRPSLAAPVALAALLFPFAAPAAAQDYDKYAAYFALTTTPLGALPPAAHGSRTDAGPGVTARYGRVSYGNDNAVSNVGLSFDFVAGTNARAAVTVGGAIPEDCSGCDPIVGGAVDLEHLLVRRSSAGSEVTVSIRPSVGFGKPTGGGSDATVLAASLGLPLALRADGGSGLSVMPYVVPGIGYGRLSANDESAGGMRPMLGLGLRIESARQSAGLLVGMQKVFVDEGETVFGAGLSFAGRQR